MVTTCFVVVLDVHAGKEAVLATRSLPPEKLAYHLKTASVIKTCLRAASQDNNEGAAEGGSSPEAVASKVSVYCPRRHSALQ